MATIAQEKAVLEGYDRWRNAQDEAGQDLSVRGYLEYRAAVVNAEVVDKIRGLYEQGNPENASSEEQAQFISAIGRILWEAEPVNPPKGSWEGAPAIIPPPAFPPPSVSSFGVA